MKNNENLNNTGFIVPKKTSLHFDEDKGKLYKFNRLSIEVIRFGNPFPAAFIKTKNRNWNGYLPSRLFPFLFYEPSIEKLNSDNEGLRRFAEYRLDIYKTIAAWVGQETVDLIKMFKSRQWHIYTLLFNGAKESHELICTNPALGYLITMHHYFHKLKSRSYKRSERSLIRKKRKDILEYFGFPRKEAVVRIFSKLDPSSCNFERFNAWRKEMSRSPDLIRRLSFYEKHNDLSLAILNSEDLYPIVHYNLIDQLAKGKQNDYDLNAVYMLFDIIRMQTTLSVLNIPARNVFFRTIGEIYEVHDEMVDLMMKVSTGKECQYGAGLLPDVKNDDLHLEGITDFRNLLLEGKTMHHCIASYHDQLKRSEGYHVAKMILPERLTILYRQDKKRCKLIEVKGKCNTNPREESLQIIRNWIGGQEVITLGTPQLTVFDDFNDY